jgi:hypothetical protein
MSRAKELGIAALFFASWFAVMFLNGCTAPHASGWN